MTCGAQHVPSARQVQVRCSELDDEGPAITAITYSINGGNNIRGRCEYWPHCYVCAHSVRICYREERSLRTRHGIRGLFAQS